MDRSNKEFLYCNSMQVVEWVSETEENDVIFVEYAEDRGESNSDIEALKDFAASERENFISWLVRYHENVALDYISAHYKDYVEYEIEEQMTDLLTYGVEEDCG